MMSDLEKLKQLQNALQRQAPLSLEEARAQLPALITAELADEPDVDVAFAAVLSAIDAHPELAEEYDQLYHELQAFAGQPVTPAPPAPAFFQAPQPQASGAGLVEWGRQAVGRL